MKVHVVNGGVNFQGKAATASSCSICLICACAPAPVQARAATRAPAGSTAHWRPARRQGLWPPAPAAGRKERHKQHFGVGLVVGSTPLSLPQRRQSRSTGAAHLCCAIQDAETGSTCCNFLCQRPMQVTRSTHLELTLARSTSSSSGVSASWLDGRTTSHTTCIMSTHATREQKTLPQGQPKNAVQQRQVHRIMQHQQAAAHCSSADRHPYSAARYSSADFFSPAPSNARGSEVVPTGAGADATGAAETGGAGRAAPAAAPASALCSGAASAAGFVAWPAGLAAAAPAAFPVAAPAAGLA